MYKIYAKNLDKETLKQFREAMSLECNIQGALMPDAHKGYTLPIGAVIKSKDYIFPSYVGYDIGCGVSGVKLDIYKDDIDLENLKNEIIKNIPLGYSKNGKILPFEIKDTTPIATHIYKTYGKYYLIYAFIVFCCYDVIFTKHMENIILGHWVVEIILLN